MYPHFFATNFQPFKKEIGWRKGEGGGEHIDLLEVTFVICYVVIYNMYHVSLAFAEGPSNILRKLYNRQARYFFYDLGVN